MNGDDRKAFTRNGHNWVHKFSVIAGAFDIEVQTIVDGEVVVIHEGRTNFSELQADLARGDQDRLVYFVFDLLWLDGQVPACQEGAAEGVDREQSNQGADPL
nr:hypothetical protein [Bradyrhizobium arachidis]